MYSLSDNHIDRSGLARLQWMDVDVDVDVDVAGSGGV